MVYRVRGKSMRYIACFGFLGFLGAGGMLRDGMGVRFLWVLFGWMLG